MSLDGAILVKCSVCKCEQQKLKYEAGHGWHCPVCRTNLKGESYDSERSERSDDLGLFSVHGEVPDKGKLQ